MCLDCDRESIRKTVRWRVQQDPDPLTMEHAKWEVSAIMDDGEAIWISSWPDRYSCHDFLDRLFVALAVLEQECIETYFRPV